MFTIENIFHMIKTSSEFIIFQDQDHAKIVLFGAASKVTSQTIEMTATMCTCHRCFCSLLNTCVRPIKKFE
jgi:hypothetical protein